MAPMLVWGIPSSRDLANHFRFALPFYEAIRSGNWHPGWLAESNGGFGDASFRFYPPALYYVMALGRALTGNWYASTVLTFALVSVAGALGIYLWAREFTTSTNAMWAGIFYSLAPYHLNQFFQALMLAEFAGASVLPFAFLFVERICRHRRLRDVAGLAASYALLVLTHLPLAVIGSIALAVYALLRMDRKKFLSTVAALSLSVGVGLVASASYWTTMLFELKWIRADNVNPEPGVDYRHNFVLSTFSPDSLNVWWMNILLLATVAMFWPAMILVTRAARQIRKSSNKDGSTTVVVALTVLLSITVFMTTPLSRPLWNRVRFLQETQFPWRWLTITMMACSILLALSIPFWSRLAKTRRRSIAILACGTIVMSLAFSASHIVREARWLSPPQFQQTLSEIPGSPGVYQWLPVWAHDPLPKMSTPVDSAGRDVTIKEWSPERRIFHVNAGAPTEARIRTFFYPHWTAMADGQQLPVHPDQSGALMVSLPQNSADVTIEFREPTRVKYAAGLSIFGWLLIGGLLPIGRIRRESRR
jgi:uncharacterized membrane protein